MVGNSMWGGREKNNLNKLTFGIVVVVGYSNHYKSKRTFMRKLLFSLALLFYIASANAQIISTVAGTGIAGVTGSFEGDGGPAIAAKLYGPTGIILDAVGNIIFVDARNNRVRKVDIATGIITTIAGNGAWALTGDGGLAVDASLRAPNDLAIDAVGNIYVSEDHNIRKISTSGIITTYAGDTAWLGGGYGGDGGPATAALLNSPRGIAIDAVGNLYIADWYNQRIRKVDAAGIITTIAGTGFGAGTSSHGGFSGDGGPATAANLSRPSDIVIDGSGNLYISDNDRIRKIDGAGIINTIYGTGSLGVEGDGGPASAANIENSKLFLDVAGNLYVTNPYHVRKIDPSGMINKIAGCASPSCGLGDGGPPLDASVRAMTAGVVVHPVTGDIFIADIQNNRIRKIAYAATEVSTLTKTREVYLYPNPANDIITVESEGSISDIVIKDMLGRSIFASHYKGINQADIDIASVPAGIYFLSVNNTEVKKFVKQ